MTLSVLKIEGNILSKVIEYCKKHVKWHAEFTDIDQSTMFDLIPASNYLNVKRFVRRFNGLLSDIYCSLFQQRPYPSPGIVLRRNVEVASLQKKKSSSHFTEILKSGDGSDGLEDKD
ncbi:hypothetical protein AALP_AAs43932U000100 [Arabis alpina]|uniref:SKP1 component POZ domain-containing protein n=1 Tax=Arabis alpina TaxID=50452 RepID=A0A087G376_ARAAL|nr:hypothetical protein AALP_AAs43932U000100 [Arabis alpina]